MNVELVLVYVENKSKWIKLLVPLIDAIIRNSSDSGFCLIYIILETPGIHWHHANQGIKNLRAI